MYKNDGIVKRYSESFNLKILAELSTEKYSKKQLGDSSADNRITISRWIEQHNREGQMNNA